MTKRKKTSGTRGPSETPKPVSTVFKTPRLVAPRPSKSHPAVSTPSVQPVEETNKTPRPTFSCAECKRLKLKCSRSWPCTSCEKRGCAQICPNGTIRTVKGKRHILADTEELHGRINDLELALAQSQARQTNDPHPLLAATYSFTTREPLIPGGKPAPASEAPTDLQERNDEDIAEEVEDEEEEVGGEVVQSTTGTMTIGRAGESRFIGSFAGSEYLRTGSGSLPVDIQRDGGGERRVVISGLATPPATAAMLNDSGFDVRLHSARSGPMTPGMRMGGYADDRNADVEELKMELPDWNSEGRDMVQNYWDNVSLMHQIIPQGVFQTQYLHPAYDAQHNIHPHKMAVVYLVMATGVMFDLHRPPFHDRGAELFALGQACISAIGLEHATPSTVRALLLCGTYVLNDKHGSGAEIFWPLLGAAIKVAYSLGLHRDGSKFGLSKEETEERRLIWWELVTCDRVQSICFARPAGIAARTMDTKMPSVNYSDEDHYHHTKYRLAAVMEKVNNIQTQVAPVPYSQFKNLDAELVEFKKTFADALLPDVIMSCLPNDSTVPPHLIFHRLTIRLLLAQSRLLLNRQFFATALKENPEDPSYCKHGDSFVALFEAAQAIVQVVQRLVVYHPSLVARWWVYWFHAFSSACCFAAIAIQAPKSAFAAPAYDGLITVLDLALAAPAGCRAKKGLPVILRLQARAQDSMRRAGRQGDVNVSLRPNMPGRLAPYIPSPEALRRAEIVEAEDDDLGHLAGRSRLRRIKGKESNLRSESVSAEGGNGSVQNGGEEEGGYQGSPIQQHHQHHSSGSSIPFGTDYSMPAPGMFHRHPYDTRPQTGGGIITGFSPSSAISGSTTTTLADRPWEGVVPPPPPPPPSALLDYMPAPMFGMGTTVDGMNGGWGNAGYAYNPVQPISMSDPFPTLTSGPPITYTQQYGDPVDFTHSNGNPPIWSPPPSSFPSNTHHVASGFNLTYPSQPGPSGTMAQNAGGSGQAGGNYDGQGMMVDFNAGLDLDMSLAMGFGDGSTGAGTGLAAGAIWDWDFLMNGITSEVVQDNREG